MGDDYEKAETSAVLIENGQRQLNWCFCNIILGAQFIAFLFCLRSRGCYSDNEEWMLCVPHRKADGFYIEIYNVGNADHAFRDVQMIFL